MSFIILTKAEKIIVLSILSNSVALSMKAQRWGWKVSKINLMTNKVIKYT